ncbi:unnamed protein product [Clavelina lepadiformis]|uniref:Phosphoribosyltransferase domain-containing protein n=1 Tax=Clavelina lepadiformis TaxID=159417 RepID=A0ABP0FX32_CLALP
MHGQIYKENSKCLIVEDVGLVTTGSSVLETAELLRKHNIVTSDAVVLLDRQQGEKEKLAEKGISLRSVLTLVEIVESLREMNKIEKAVVNERGGYRKRAVLSKHFITRKLFEMAGRNCIRGKLWNFNFANQASDKETGHSCVHGRVLKQGTINPDLLPHGAYKVVY